MIPSYATAIDDVEGSPQWVFNVRGTIATPSDLATASATLVTKLKAIAAGLTTPFDTSSWASTPDTPTAATYFAALRTYATVTLSPPVDPAPIDSAWSRFCAVASPGSFEAATEMIAYAASLSPPFQGAGGWNDASSTAVFAERASTLFAYGFNLASGQFVPPYAGTLATPFTTAAASDAYQAARAYAVSISASTAALDAAWQCYGDVVSPGGIAYAAFLVSNGAPSTINAAASSIEFGFLAAQYQGTSNSASNAAWNAYKAIAIGGSYISSIAPFLPNL